MKLELNFVRQKGKSYVEISSNKSERVGTYKLEKTKDITNALVSYFRNVENLSFEEV